MSADMCYRVRLEVRRQSRVPVVNFRLVWTLSCCSLSSQAGPGDSRLPYLHQSHHPKSTSPSELRQSHLLTSPLPHSSISIPVSIGNRVSKLLGLAMRGDSEKGFATWLYEPCEGTNPLKLVGEQDGDRATCKIHAAYFGANQFRNQTPLQENNWHLARSARLLGSPQKRPGGTAFSP